MGDDGMKTDVEDSCLGNRRTKDEGIEINMGVHCPEN